MKSMLLRCSLCCLVVMLAAEACSDVSGPDRRQISLSGSWAVSDTFGLAGTITLTDGSISTTAFQDTLERWRLAYGDTLSILGFATGSGAFTLHGVALPTESCGVMIVKQWHHRDPGPDTLYNARAICADIWLESLASTPQRSPTTSLAFDLAETAIPGLQDTSSACREFGGCISPYTHSAIDLTRQ